MQSVLQRSCPLAGQRGLHVTAQSGQALALDVVEVFFGDGAPEPVQLVCDRRLLAGICCLPSDFAKQGEQPREQCGVIGAVPPRLRDGQVQQLGEGRQADHRARRVVAAQRLEAEVAMFEVAQ